MQRFTRVIAGLLAGAALTGIAPGVAQAGNAPSYFPDASDNGGVVAFESSASNLGTGVANGTVTQIYRHDRSTGNKVLVSIGADGEPGDTHSNEPRVSGDGRYVVYSSGAKNLSTRDHDASRDVFLYDAAADSTRLVSIRSDGGIATGNSQEAAVSDDGRWVVFASQGQLDASDRDFQFDVYLRDMRDGTVARLSQRPAGASGHSAEPVISADGRYVAFSSAVAQVAGVTGGNHVYRYDTLTGAVALVSGASGGANTPGNAGGSNPSISGDGRYVAFQTSSTNLQPVDGVTVTSTQIVRKDLQTGDVVVMSRYDAGGAYNGQQTDPDLSTNGFWVAFESTESQTGSHAGPNGNVIDVYAANAAGIEPKRITVGSDAAYNHNLKPALTDDAMPRVFFHTTNTMAWDGPCRSDATQTDRDTISDIYSRVAGSASVYEWASCNSQTDPAPDPPSSLNPLFSGSSSTSVRLAVRDQSHNEDRFELRFRRFGADWSYRDIAARPGDENTATQTGCKTNELAGGSAQNYCFDVTGLSDGTGYEFQLRARRGSTARSGWTPLAASRTQFPNEVIQSQSYPSTGLGESQKRFKVTSLMGDPVDVRFGTFAYDHTDLSMPGVGPDIRITRTYNSAAAATSGILGYGWRLSFESRVTVASGVASVTLDDGRVERFTLSGGTWTPDPGIVDTFESLTGGGYRLRGRDDLARTYSSSGQLTSISDAFGNVITVSRDSNGRVATLTDDANRVWTVTYDASNRVSQIKDPADRRVLYRYDAAGNLSEYQNPDDGVTTYTYDAAHRITRITDARGNLVVSHIYDDNGKVVEQTEPRGVTLFEYFDGYTLTTDPLGRVTRTVFDADFRVTRIVDPAGGEKTFTYDSAGRVLTETDELGRTKAFGYDARGNQTTVTDARNRVTRFAYDGADDVTSITDPRNGVTTLTRGSGGLVTKKTDPLGKATTYTYDANGQMLTETDPTGAVTTFAYDAAGNVTRITDARGKATVKQYDAAGNLTRITDPLGRVSTTTWSPLGLPVLETAFDGGTTTHAYDANGNEISTTNPRGKVTTRAYDAANQLLSVTDARGGVTSHTYDKGGRRITSRDPAGRVTRTTYDALDRPTAVESPSGARTTMTYDAVGNLLTRTNARGKTTSYGYDASNRLIRVTEPGGGVTAYEYDDSGARTKVTDARGSVTRFAYDGAGRLTSTTDPRDGVSTVEYDDAGRPVRTVDAAGGAVAREYDPAGNLVRRTAAGVSETFVYDDAGRLVAATSPAGSVGLTRDAAGRVTRAVTPAGTVVSAFDLNGNRTRLQTPGQVITTAYDELDRAVSVARDGAVVARYAYGPTGLPVAEQLADGTLTTRAYDPDGRLVGIVTQRGARTLQRVAYALDANGNRVRETSTGLSARHEYDALDRLISTSLRVTPEAGASRTRSESLAWTYDEVGNRTSATRGSETVTSTYDAANRLTRVGSRDVDVDAAGRTRSDGSSAFAYDGFGRLVGVSGRDAATYTYDALGNRIGDSGRPLLVDAGQPGPAAVLSVGSTAMAHGPLGRVMETPASGPATVPHADGLGSARASLTVGGRSAGVQAFRPFGERLTGGRGEDGSASGAFGFAGELQSGRLVHLRARDYSTELGRFLTPDPAPSVPELPQTGNTYAYAVNNPTLLTDPTGKCAICAWVGNAWNTAVAAVTNVFSGGASSKPAPNPPPAPQRNVTGSKGLAESSGNKGLGSLSGGAGVVAGGSANLIGTASGNLIGTASGNLIGQAGGNLIGQAGGNLIGQAGGNILNQNNAGILNQNNAGILNQNNAGILNQNNAGLIGQAGGNLLSDNGLGLISDNGLGLINQSASSLIGQAGGNLRGMGGI